MIRGGPQPNVGTRRVGRDDWTGKTGEQRHKLLSDRAGRGRRDVADVAISSTDEILLRGFVDGLPNLVGPSPGTAAIVTPDGTIPARGVVGTWYALYREFDDIERPAGISVANARHAREVCGVWFGD